MFILRLKNTIAKAYRTYRTLRFTHKLLSCYFKKDFYSQANNVLLNLIKRIIKKLILNNKELIPGFRY